MPIGLAHGVIFKREIGKGEVVSWRDVEYGDEQVIRVRREMERVFRGS